MVGFTVRYSFRQRFGVSARRAYEWSTDYRPEDHSMAGEPGQRRVLRLSDDALLLRDTIPRPRGRSVIKVKLVRLDPANLSWTNTHLSGPIQHSQFFYRIVSEGKRRSRLEFFGFQHEQRRVRPSPAQLRAWSRRLQREDSDLWKRYAKIMRSDLTT